MADPAIALDHEAPRQGQVQGPGPGQIIVEAPRFIDRNRIFVNPPVTHIGSGDSQLKEIRILNRTGGTILVWLPNGQHYLDKAHEELVTPITIESGGEHALPVKASAEEGLYPYHVYCERTGSGAEGHSEPHIGCP